VRCRTSTAAAEDSEATRAFYPFAFRLVVTYTFDEAGLDVALKIVNTGEETLPASVGGHPAFNWPLQPGRPKERYALTFANEESFPVRRLDVGLLRAAAQQSPISGKLLSLSKSSVHRRRRRLR
jgi:galactose mutarotase-like enzyme